MPLTVDVDHRVHQHRQSFWFSLRCTHHNHGSESALHWESAVFAVLGGFFPPLAFVLRYLGRAQRDLNLVILPNHEPFFPAGGWAIPLSPMIAYRDISLRNRDKNKVFCGS